MRQKSAMTGRAHDVGGKEIDESTRYRSFNGFCFKYHIIDYSTVHAKSTIVTTDRDSIRKNEWPPQTLKGAV